ncbi:unnamed protein product [Malus baccata var. baccata]
MIFSCYYVHRNIENLIQEAVRRLLVLLKNGESVDKPVISQKSTVMQINLDIRVAGGPSSGREQAAMISQKNTVDPTTEVVYNENPDSDLVKSNEFSHAIFVVGEHRYAENYGDSLDSTIAGPRPSTTTNVCRAVKCVVTSSLTLLLRSNLMF